MMLYQLRVLLIQLKFIMLARKIVNIPKFLSYTLVSPAFYFISTSQIHLFQSKFHRQGLHSLKKNRTIQKLLANNLITIERIQKQLYNTRKMLIQEKIHDKTLRVPHQIQNNLIILKYTQLYESLIKVISGCQINNEWMYSCISWYNMIAFYDGLLQRVFQADKIEIVYVVNALHNMTLQKIEVSEKFKYNVRNLYKNLSHGLEVSLLRKLQGIINLSVLNFSKRKYYQKYCNTHIENLLKTLDSYSSESINNLIWLIQTTIKCMHDEQINILKFEKYLLTNHLKLTMQDANRLINAYNLKGKINMNIYQVYIKPFIIMNKMNGINDIIESIKFIIYSEANDLIFLSELIQKLEKAQIIGITNQNLRILNILLHYLTFAKLKNIKIKINKQLETKLRHYCIQNHEQGNFINSSAFFDIKQNIPEIKDTKIKSNKKDRKDNDKQSKEKQSKSSIPCFNTLNKGKMTTLTTLDPQETANFISFYEKNITLMNLGQYDIYQKVSFSCFQLQFLLVHKTTKAMINIQTEQIQYTFNSGHFTRQMQIRDAILANYKIKPDHIYASKYTNKSLIDDNDYLMNKKIKMYKKNQ